MSRAGCRKRPLDVLPLVLGWEVVPRFLGLEGAGDTPQRVPVTAVLAGGRVLLDGGLGPDVVRRPAAFAGLYPHGLPERVDVLEALRAAGADPDAIELLAVSHLHLDHTGAVRALPGRPVVVQAAELEHAARTGDREGYWPPDVEQAQWRVLHGDGAVAPGIRALFTPGHTPGHQSFVIDDRLVVAADALQVIENLELDRPVGPASDTDDPAARRASHDRIAKLGLRVLPGHCPRTWGDPSALAAVLAGGG